MELQNIASNQVNFKSQVQTQTSPIDKIKETLNDLGFKQDGEMSQAEITATIVGISATALLAVLGYMRKGDTKPVQEIVEQAQNVAQEVTQEVSENIGKKSNQVAQDVQSELAQRIVKEQTAQEAQAFYANLHGYNRTAKSAQESAQAMLNNPKFVQNQIEDGASKSILKETATYNQNHEAKKQAKALIDDTAEKTKNKQDEIQSEIARINKTAQNAYENLDSINKQIEQAQTVEEVEEAIAKLDAQKRRCIEIVRAERQLDGDFNLTDEQIAQTSARADMRAIKTQISSTRKTADAKIAQLQETSAKKEAFIEANPELVAKGEAQKAKATARKASKTRNNPAYNNTMKKMSGYNKSQLQEIINNPKSSNVQKQVAKDLLNSF